MKAGLLRWGHRVVFTYTSSQGEEKRLGHKSNLRVFGCCTSNPLCNECVRLGVGEEQQDSLQFSRHERKLSAFEMSHRFLITKEPPDFISAQQKKRQRL